jgi:molybdopterin synthase catalytic subunit
MKKIILFNAQTGTLFASLDSQDFNVDGIDTDLFLYREVEMSEGDFWYGDYETGKLCNENEIQIVTQQTLRDNAIKKIFSKYFYIDQLKIINDQLKATISEENQTTAFKDMVTFIDEVRDEYHLKKEAYISNPEMYVWISDEAAQEFSDNRLEGIGL